MTTPSSRDHAQDSVPSTDAAAVWTAPPVTPAPRRRSSRQTTLALGVCVAIGMGVAVYLTSGSDDLGSGNFCRDVKALNVMYNGEDASGDPGYDTTLPDKMRHLAMEAPTAQSRKDLLLIANGMATLTSSGELPEDMDAFDAAGDRVDTVVKETCGFTTGDE